MKKFTLVVATIVIITTALINGCKKYTATATVLSSTNGIVTIELKNGDRYSFEGWTDKEILTVQIDNKQLIGIVK